MITWLMMITWKTVKRLTPIALLICLCSQTFSEPVGSQTTGCYSDAPKVLVAKVEETATAIAQSIDATEAGNQLLRHFNEMMIYTVADAVSSSTADLRNLEVYRYLGETARTDKQKGASAKSEGSTSAIEKPGLIQLLGFAVENGAIQQQISGTRLSLLTSPYALIASAYGDTAETYQKYNLFNRIGVSATFNLNDQSVPLANVNKKELTEWSVRARLAGDRNTRSDKFQQFFARSIKPKIERRLQIITTAESGVFLQKTGLEQIRRTLRDKLKNDVTALFGRIGSQSEDAKVSTIKEMILCFLKSSVFEPINSGQIKIDAAARDQITGKFIPSLVAAHEDLEQARALLDQYLSEFNNTPLLTFAFTNHRTTTGSDYSEFKLLFEGNVRPMKIVANAGVSVYNNPERALNQQKIRDFGVAVSLEGEANSPFLKGTADLSKITYSFTGSFEHMKENEGMPTRKADIAVAQFKVDIPIKMGVSIPLSFTYANATELIKEKHIRGNFGLTFDVDKLFALTRRVLNP